ncbi:central glycolytic genes regulator [Bacillaceae bacterium JMAK1]|nr:central glycolytic genes regulator [Bacillaceae bacterium JMAK1]
MDETLLKWQQKLQPDLMDNLIRRYHLLRYIRVSEPVGRRALAQEMDISERVLRKEVELFKNEQLLLIETQGMRLTEDGKNLLEALESSIQVLTGRTSLQAKLERALNVKRVIVAPGNSDEQDWVKKEMNRACVDEMIQTLGEGDVVAVAGGTTLAALATSIYPHARLSNVTFVPARGGLGEDVELQANTISADLAKQAEANYRLLHVPDQLSETAYDSLIEEPGIRELLQLIRHPRMVIHSVGDALSMATRRGTTEEHLQGLEAKNAQSEAFGYYFDHHGKIVHKERTIGLQLSDLNEEQMVITVAGGASKAKAIASYMTHRPSDLLITDEAAAKAVLDTLEEDL